MYSRAKFVLVLQGDWYLVSGARTLKYACTLLGVSPLLRRQTVRCPRHPMYSILTSTSEVMCIKIKTHKDYFMYEPQCPALLQDVEHVYTGTSH